MGYNSIPLLSIIIIHTRIRLYLFCFCLVIKQKYNLIWWMQQFTSSTQRKRWRKIPIFKVSWDRKYYIYFSLGANFIFRKNLERENIITFSTLIFYFTNINKREKYNLNKFRSYRWFEAWFKQAIVNCFSLIEEKKKIKQRFDLYIFYELTF